MKNTNLLEANGVNVKASLELLGDLDTYDKIIRDYLDGVSSKIDELTKYKEVGDMTNYAILVHSLKSDAKYLGFTRLAELAYEHELESKENNLYFVTDNFNKLMEECKRINNLVKQYLGEEVLVEQQKKVVKDKAILVVDDSSIIRNFIEKIFDNEFKVINASDGKVALDIINTSNENIIGVLLDFNMPNVNGFEVLDYFKENDLFKKFAVSIITGEDTKEAIDKAFTYPIVDVLTKPFNERDIKRIVDKTIEFNSIIS